MPRARRGLLGTALVLAPFILPFVGSCGVIGAGFVAEAHNTERALAPRDIAAAPKDAYVDVTARFREVARDPFPCDSDGKIATDGARLLAIEGASEAVAFCTASDCPTTGVPVNAKGRLCDGNWPIVGCTLPMPLSLYFECKAAKSIYPTAPRVIVLGRTPGGDYVQAAIAFSVVALLLLLWAGAVAASGFRTRR